MHIINISVIWVLSAVRRVVDLVQYLHEGVREGTEQGLLIKCSIILLKIQAYWC